MCQQYQSSLLLIFQHIGSLPGIIIQMSTSELIFFAWFHILDFVFLWFIPFPCPPSPPAWLLKKTTAVANMASLSQIMMVVACLGSFIHIFWTLVDNAFAFFVHYCFLIFYIVNNNAYFVTVICIYSNLLASKMTMFVQILGVGEDLSYKKCNSNWASFFKHF